MGNNKRREKNTARSKSAGVPKTTRRIASDKTKGGSIVRPSGSKRSERLDEGRGQQPGHNRPMDGEPLLNVPASEPIQRKEPSQLHGGNEKIMMPRLEMKFEKLSVDKINRAAYNPRKDLQPEDPEYQMLKQAILTHGLVDPLIVNEVNNVLVGGHQRLKILTQEFGVKEVTCSLVHIEDENEEVALNISLNANAGSWEFPKLQIALARFEGLDVNDPLRVGLGFTSIAFNEALNWKEGGLSGGAESREVGYAQKFELIVECTDESEQKRLFDELVSKGHVCRALSL